MTTPNLSLAPRGERSWSAGIEYTVHFAITSHLELTTKPSTYRRQPDNPVTMLATRLQLRWTWRDGEWGLNWAFHGRRYRKTKNDWSPHEQGFMHEHNLDLPEWVLPLIEANTPTMQPTAEYGETPATATR